MRLFSILAMTTLLSAPAFAADLGTYRPGSPYNSVKAPGADVCESHCAGDAQCKGWNYVKINPRSPGVCEFNSKAVSPIESAISISGNGAASLAPNLMQGGTNTVRVGTSAQPKARSQTHQVRPTRRVVREAVPQRIQPQSTAHRSPTTQGGSLTDQQNRYRQATGDIQKPQIRHPQIQQRQIRPQQQAARPQMQRRPQAQPQGQQRLMRDPRIQGRQQHPNFQHNLDGAGRLLNPQQGVIPQHRMVDPRYQNPQQLVAPQGRPPVGVPIQGPQTRNTRAPQNPHAQAAPLPRGSVNSPVTHQNGQQRIQEAARQTHQQQAQMQNMSFEQAQESLFGSLNDDVKTPKPLVNLPRDPDAPIATAQSRPTVPVAQEAIGALAGAPRG